MARINIVIPPLDPEKFSGGILCLLEYAKGLRALGHSVTLVPLLPSRQPTWFPGDIGTIPDVPLPADIPDSLRRERHLLLPIEVLYGLFLRYTREVLQQERFQADVTLATACVTALPVHLFGSGKRFYFAQHFEPYFGIEVGSTRWWEHQAMETYRLNLQLIANSSWLANKLREEAGVNALLCPNAIDHSVFSGHPKTAMSSNEVTVISYGGRLAEWKGFRDMADAVRLAREQLPGINLKWQVYGSSVLEPSNSIASYEPLGFLGQRDLAEAYRSADILLSASWYESFPLFPLEAMACGLPVITTQPGTEEFAIPGVTAEVVEARNPGDIAQGLIRLITQHSHRTTIAARGNEIARKFDWKSATTRMEQILVGPDVG